MEVAILATGLFVFLAHMLDALFQRTRVPDILLLMIIGAFLGPIGGVIPPEFTAQVGGFLSISTLIVILTESGMSLEIRALAQSAARSMPFAILAFAGSVALVAVLAKVFLGLDWWASIMAGAILGGTSSSVVIPILRNVGASTETTMILTIESALTDVLCIIGAIGIATALAAGGNVETGGLLGGALVSLIGASLYGAVLGVGWTIFLAIVPRMRNAMFTTLAFALVVYGSAETMGISGAIAALAFGVALGNVPENASIRTRFWNRRTQKVEKRDLVIKHVTRQERRLYAEVVFLLKAFFFVYLGTQLRLESFASALALLALVLTAIVLVPRYPLVLTMLKRETTTRREAMLAVALGPRGMAAAVLAQVPVQMGVPDTQSLAEVVTMMVFFSITATAVFVFLIERGKLAAVGASLFRRFPETVEVAAPAEEGKSPDPVEVVAAGEASQPAPVEAGATSAPQASTDTAATPAAEPDAASNVLLDESGAEPAGGGGGGDFIAPERLAHDGSDEGAEGDGEGDFLREGPHRR